MRGSAVHGIRVLIVAGMIGLGVGQVRAQATAHTAQATGAASNTGVKGESAEELVYQGKILPIVTDVYNTLNNLGTGLNDGSTSEIAQAGDQFANEQQRFEAVKPVPRALRGVASTMDKGLHQLTSGTRALVTGLQASDNNAEQQAAKVLAQGIKQFQTAVSQVRQLAGPTNQGKPSSNNAGPVPTPIIKGLP